MMGAMAGPIIASYSDDALLQLVVQRDIEAFGEMYDRHAPYMYNLIRLLFEIQLPQNIFYRKVFGEFG